MKESGRVRLGAIVFVLLLVAVVARFVWIWANPARRLLEQAKELMAAGKYDSALAVLDEAVEKDPDAPLVHYHRAICLAERHRFGEALEAFGRTLELDPQEANAAFNRGKILHHLDRCPEALAELDRALASRGRLVEQNVANAWLLKAECHYRLAMRGFASGDTAAERHGRQARLAFETYLNTRPEAPDRGAVRKKIEILQDPSAYPQVLERYRQKTGEGKMTRTGRPR